MSLSRQSSFSSVSSNSDYEDDCFIRFKNHTVIIEIFYIIMMVFPMKNFILVLTESLRERLRGSLPKSVPVDFGLEKTFALYFYHQH